MNHLSHNTYGAIHQPLLGEVLGIQRAACSDPFPKTLPTFGYQKRGTPSF